MDRLGNKLSEHPRARLGTLGWALRFASVGLGGGVLAAMVVDAMGGTFRGDPVPRAVGAVAALLLTGVGLALALSSLRDLWSEECIAIHEDGLLRTTRSGSEVLRWEDVEGLGLSMTGLGRYTLWFSGARTVELSSARYGGVDGDVGDLLRQKTHAVLFPKYVQTLDAKGRIKLGTVTIDRKKLCTQTQEIPFKGLVSVRRDGAKLVFADGRGTESRVDVGTQPNIHLMIALAEHYRR